MPEITSLNAETRGRVGKGAARAIRRAGRVPAVIYGDGKDPVAVSLEPRELSRVISKPGFLATVVDVAVDGTTHRTLPRDVQYHPVTDFPLHVDFMRVGAGAQVTVTVPVNFINQERSPGLRRGGILNIVRHGIEVRCSVDVIPDRLVVALDGLDIGDSLHINAVVLPEGVRPVTTERDFTIATIGASSAVREEAAAATSTVPEEGAEEAAPAGAAAATAASA
ncbi:MAG TPA: 50S ribosomal protein L25/general stress protein Ctc [Stellaceae bacterium]|jgi:large subunit ribosomal protein L25